MGTTGVEERAAFGDAMAVCGLFLLGAWGGLLAMFANDPGMAFHGVLFLVAGVAGGLFVLNVSFGKTDWHAPVTDYVDGPMKVASIAALIWGIAGFAVGDVIAWQLAIPALNLDLPWTSFGA